MIGEDDMVFVDEALNVSEAEQRKVRGRLLRLIPKDVKIVVSGHTHRRGAEKLGRVYWVNAGTLRADDNPCFAIFDLVKKSIEFYNLDSDGTVLKNPSAF